MRLSSTQIEAIKQEAGHFFDAKAEVWLFGSRADDTAKGGMNSLRKIRGFTMVELITIMVVLGILAAVAAPRFFDRNTFDSRGFYDQLISTLRYAQKTAIAQHITVCVVDAATEIGLFAANCTTPLNVLASQRCPTDGADYRHKVCTPAGVSITSAPAGSLSFTALGSTAAQKTYTVSGYSTPVTVELETGYVH